MEGALAGVRVIEFANYVSGPYAGMLLGDLGADVIKIEEPTRGDPFRGWGRVDYSPTFASVNRNKKSVTIDLKSEAGKADARALVNGADVVIENFRPGTIERLGLGYDTFAADHPRLVWCSITGFGSDGPYAHRPGYDTVGVAMSGLLSLLTDPANPQPMGISLSDHLAGITACNGILAAIIARGRTGRGQRVDTSLLESSISFCGENMARYFDNGKVPFRATRTRQAQVYAVRLSAGPNGSKTPALKARNLAARITTSCMKGCHRFWPQSRAPTGWKSWRRRTCPAHRLTRSTTCSTTRRSSIWA